MEEAVAVLESAWNTSSVQSRSRISETVVVLMLVVDSVESVTKKAIGHISKQVPHIGSRMIIVIILSFIINQTHSSVQCAAVMTHCSLIRVPPQLTSACFLELGSSHIKPTCQPSSPFTASSPPTIRWTLSSAESRSSGPSLFLPQTAMIWWHLLSCVSASQLFAP